MQKIRHSSDLVDEQKSHIVHSITAVLVKVCTIYTELGLNLLNICIDYICPSSNYRGDFVFISTRATETLLFDTTGHVLGTMQTNVMPLHFLYCYIF